MRLSCFSLSHSCCMQVTLLLLILLQNCSISVVGKDQDLVIYSDEGVAPYVSFDSELVFSQIVCFLRLWLQLCQSGRGMCCVTCCHSMSSLCDISITKRKLCLIMQVEMAKKTQGCISYGFLNAKQRKDSFVSCYYKG